MISDERNVNSWIGKFVNKNVYNAAGALVKTAHSRLNAHEASLLRAHGIRLSAADFETAEEAASAVADTAYAELDDIFRSVRDGGRLRIEAIEKSVMPVIRICLEEAGGVIGLLLALQGKDHDTCRHSVAVAVLSAQLGKWLKLNEDGITDLIKAALLHDIGKLLIASDIIHKPGKLTESEYDEMKRHTVIGYNLILDHGLDEVYAKPALQHHERLDGSGYPYRLKADSIDYFSRIISVADVFHAMCSKRDYKKKIPFHEVIREIHQEAFGRFDAEIVSVFTARMMELLIGQEVTLTNGQRGKIVSVNPNDPWNPLVQVERGFVNLTMHPDLNILHL